MKKLVLASLIVVLVFMALGSAGYAYAQSAQPQSGTFGPGTMQGEMVGVGRHGRGGIHGSYGSAGEGFVPMHDYILEVFANAFTLSVDELQARLEAGETMFNIAEGQGVTLEEFRSTMIEVRTTAINQLVADGVITQEQADWMLERMSRMWQGVGSGECSMSGGSSGRYGRWNRATQEQP